MRALHDMPRVTRVAALFPPLFATLYASSVGAEAASEAPRPRWSIGTSAWLLANLFPDPPQFYFLELSRAVGERDALVIEPVTWTYGGPIGIPYGSSFGDVTWDYPGRVRSVGLGLGWRRQLYRGLEASGRAIHFLQIYEERGRAAQTGYQLFLQARVGWRWTFGGFWLEPAVAFNWWPIERGRPASFRAKDDRWPSYFLFEPWLNLGFGW